MAKFRDPELDNAKAARRVFLSLSDAGRRFVIGQVNARQHQEAVRRNIARANGVTGMGVTATPKSRTSEQAARILQAFGKTKKQKGLKQPKRQDVGSATYRSQFNKNFR